MSALDQIFKMFQQGANNVVHAGQQAEQTIARLPQAAVQAGQIAGNTISHLPQQIAQGAINTGVDMGTRSLYGVQKAFPQLPLPKDLVYRVANSDMQRQANWPGLIHIPFHTKPTALEQAQMQQYQNASPTQRLAIDSILGEGSDEWQITKDASAKANPYFFDAPAEDQAGKALKAKVLTDPAFLEGLKEYLQNIPVSGDDLYSRHVAGEAYPNPSGQRFILFDENLPNSKTGMDEEVVRHEMLHQAVNAFGIKKLNNFMEDLKKAYTRDPGRYQPVINYMQGYKKAMPEYFQNNPTNEANEYFAQTGALYGPELLTDPYLAKYYQNVFQSVPGAQRPLIDREQDMRRELDKHRVPQYGDDDYVGPKPIQGKVKVRR